MDSTTDEKIVSVPYFVYESSQDRLERANRRLVIALIAAIIALLLTNAYWLHSWSQYDYAGEESVVTVDSRNGVRGARQRQKPRRVLRGDGRAHEYAQDR